jgi:hypothetical protein
MELSPGFWLLSRFAMSGSGLLNKNLVKGEARNVLLSGEEVRFDKRDKRAALPTEVVSRQPKKDLRSEKEKQTEQIAQLVQIPRRDIFQKKVKDRQKWFYRAVEALQKRVVDANWLFDIITDKGFAAGVGAKGATEMVAALDISLGTFSSKQQQFLQSDRFDLRKLVGEDEDERGQKRGADDDGTDPRKAAGIERRIDPADNQMYSLEEFVAEYGGSLSEPPRLWEDQAHTAFVFKS